MSEKWYYMSMGQEIGPVSRSKLSTLIESGTIDAFTIVRQGETGKWIPAEQIPGEHFSTTRVAKEPPKPQPIQRAYRPDPVAVEKPKDIPSHWLVRCPACRKQVSQTAESCPKCGHKFTAAVLREMKSSAQTEHTFGTAMAIGCGGLALFFFLFVVVAVMNTPRRSSYSPVYDYTRDRDSYVRDRASSYMSDSEYREAKETLDYLNSQGYSDSEIGSAIDAELDYRGD